MDFTEQDRELIAKLMEQGYDVLTDDEKTRVDELEAVTREIIKDGLSADELDTIRSHIAPGQPEAYYRGLLHGFRKASEMVTALEPVHIGGEAFINMAQIVMYSSYIAGYCIVIQDEFYQEDDNGTK